MKTSEAMAIINRAAGYRVTFEKREGGLLTSDHFPERDEPPIAEEEDAWNLARDFAVADPKTYVNVYVISARDWSPVADYAQRRLNTYPPYPSERSGSATADPAVAGTLR